VCAARRRRQGVAKRAVTHEGRDQGVEHGTQLMWRELEDWTGSVSQTEYILAQPMPGLERGWMRLKGGVKDKEEV